MTSRLYSCSIASATAGFFGSIVTNPAPSISKAIGGALALMSIIGKNYSVNPEDILRYTEGAIAGISLDGLIVFFLQQSTNFSLSRAIHLTSLFTTTMSYVGAKLQEYCDYRNEQEPENPPVIPGPFRRF